MVIDPPKKIAAFIAMMPGLAPSDDDLTVFYVKNVFNGQARHHILGNHTSVMTAIAAHPNWRRLMAQPGEGLQWSTLKESCRMKLR